MNTYILAALLLITFPAVCAQCSMMGWYTTSGLMGGVGLAILGIIWFALHSSLALYSGPSTNG